MMKKCSKCKTEKPATAEFYNKQTNHHTGLHDWCKICYKEYAKDRYKNNPKERKRIRKNSFRRHRSKKEYLIKYLGGKCTICGFMGCPASFDFHHKNPEKKKFAVSSQCGSFTLNRLIKEAEKCILLCANCHRELHYAEKDDGYHD